MADYDSSLPIRTENDGDAVAKICDATVTTQQLKVNVDGSIDTNPAAGSKIIITDGTDDLEVNADGSINAVVTATDLDVRDLSASQDNVAISDGTDTLGVNADGSINAVVTATDLDVRDLAFATDSVDVSGSSVTVSATDLDIRDLSAAQDSVQANLFDEAGAAFSLTNPLPVEMVSDASGDEVCDYNTSAAVAKDASVNHDYTITAAKTMLLEQVWASASGRIKVEVLVNAVPKFVGFSSTANANVEIPMKKLLKGAATQVVRITITNIDKAAMDVYSTLSGLEV